MNYRRLLHGAKFWFWVLLFVAYTATAAHMLLIDTSQDPLRNLSKVKLATVHASGDVRSAGASQAAAVLRAQSGVPFSTLAPGSTFQIVWPDGSIETLRIVSPTSSLGVEPVSELEPAAQVGPEQ